MRKIEWEIIEPDDPRSLENTNPALARYLDSWLDYMVDLGRKLDHYEIWIG